MLITPETIYSTPLPGRVVENLSNQAYHAHPSLSHSLMRNLESGIAPLRFWFNSWLNPHRTESKPTRGMNTGRLLHEAMEDYPAFCDRVKSGQLIVLPNVKGTVKAGCIGGKAGGQLSAVVNLRAKLLSIPLVERAMATGIPELSLFAQRRLEPYLAEMYGHDSITLRSRPDLDAEGVQCHWKFLPSWNMEPSRLTALIDKYRYIEGLAHYREIDRMMGRPEKRHIMYFCEIEGPHEIRAVEPSADRLDDALVYCERATNRFIELYNRFGNQEWPDFRAHPQNVYMLGEGSQHTLNMPTSYERRLAA